MRASWTPMEGRSISKRLLRRVRPVPRVALAALALLLAPAVAAQERVSFVPDHPTLLRIESRILDLGVDVTTLSRGETFIPLTRIRWIGEGFRRDEELRTVVLHVESLVTRNGKGRLATPEETLEHDLKRYPPAPAGLSLEGYIARGAGGGTVRLFPEGEVDFLAFCSADRAETSSSGCTLTAMYSPDPDLRLKIRKYKQSIPFTDFRPLVERMREIVRCLDVTEAFRAGTWRPGATNFDARMAACRNLTS